MLVDVVSLPVVVDVDVPLAEVVDPVPSEVAESLPEPEAEVVDESLAEPEVLGLVVVGLVALVAVAESLSEPLDPSSEEQAATTVNERSATIERWVKRSRHVIQSILLAANGPENANFRDLPGLQGKSLGSPSREASARAPASLASARLPAT